MSTGRSGFVSPHGQNREDNVTRPWFNPRNQRNNSRFVPIFRSQRLFDLPIDGSMGDIQRDFRQRNEARDLRNIRGDDRRLDLAVMNYQLPIKTFECIGATVSRDDFRRLTDHEIVIKLLHRYATGPYVPGERIKILRWFFVFSDFWKIADSVRYTCQEAQHFGRQVLAEQKSELQFEFSVCDVIQDYLRRWSDAKTTLGAIFEFLLAAGVVKESLAQGDFLQDDDDDSSEESWSEPSVASTPKPVPHSRAVFDLQFRVERVQRNVAEANFVQADVNEIIGIIEQALRIRVSFAECRNLLAEICKISNIREFASEGYCNRVGARRAGHKAAELKKEEGMKVFCRKFFSTIRNYMGWKSTNEIKIKMIFSFLEGIEEFEREEKANPDVVLPDTEEAENVVDEVKEVETTPKEVGDVEKDLDVAMISLVVDKVKKVPEADTCAAGYVEKASEVDSADVEEVEKNSE